MSLILYAGHEEVQRISAPGKAYIDAALRALDAEARQALPTAVEREFEPEIIGGRPTVRSIIRAVSFHFNVAVIDLLSQRRTNKLIWPRQIGMWLARKHTLRSLPAIGKCLGGRDHTTILHGVRKIERLLLSDSALAADVAAIEARITGEKT